MSTPNLTQEQWDALSSLRDWHNKNPEVSPSVGSALVAILAALPRPTMQEPQQIGYPVMADCGRTLDKHLHLRTDGVSWACRYRVVLLTWSDLTDPRDLTADEIAEHNLWRGERA